MPIIMQYVRGVGGSFATASDEKERFHSARGLRPGLPSQSPSFANLAGSFPIKQPTSRPTGLLKYASTGLIHGREDEITDCLKELGPERRSSSYQRPEYGCGFRWVRCAKGWEKRRLTGETAILFLGSGLSKSFLGLLCSDLQGIQLFS